MEPEESFANKFDQERVDRLKEIVDPVCQAIRRGEMTRAQAQDAIAQARLEAAIVAPGQIDLYDRIYGSRFERLLEQYPPVK
jgi:hypothetical protein